MEPKDRKVFEMEYDRLMVAFRKPFVSREESGLLPIQAIKDRLAMVTSGAYSYKLSGDEAVKFCTISVEIEGRMFSRGGAGIDVDDAFRQAASEWGMPVYG